MEPIHHNVTIACSPQRAFEVFTTGMGTWWDPAYTPDPATYIGIDLDPRVGGAVALRHGDATYPFGEVTQWRPGEHYQQTFWLAMDRAHPSTVDVRFTPDGGVCLVTFEHGGWDAANVAARDKYGDWPVLLGRFAEAAAGG